MQGSTSFSSVTSRSKSTRIPGGQTKSNLRGRKCGDYQPRGDTEWKVTNFDQRREEEGQGGEREREGPSEEHKTLRKFVIFIFSRDTVHRTGVTLTLQFTPFIDFLSQYVCNVNKHKLW